MVNPDFCLQWWMCSSILISFSFVHITLTKTKFLVKTRGTPRWIATIVGSISYAHLIKHSKYWWWWWWTSYGGWVAQTDHLNLIVSTQHSTQFSDQHHCKNLQHNKQPVQQWCHSIFSCRHSYEHTVGKCFNFVSKIKFNILNMQLERTLEKKKAWQIMILFNTSMIVCRGICGLCQNDENSMNTIFPGSTPFFIKFLGSPYQRIVKTWTFLLWPLQGTCVHNRANFDSFFKWRNVW